jgi:hypothetical protein
LLTLSAPPPWRCVGRYGNYSCRHPQTTLQPGQTKVLSLNFKVPSGAAGTINNCAVLRTGGASQTGGSIRSVQSQLSALGFNPGPIDGKPGKKTENAIRAFQKQRGLAATGRIDQALLNALFSQPGTADSNPNNNRACASTSIIGQITPPPPPQCTGGQFRNNSGICVCPASAPLWTGYICAGRVPNPCTGGRVRNSKGICTCPSNKPVWTGKVCIQPGCTGGRLRNNYGNCICPSHRPVWTGQNCIPPQPQSCSGGRSRNNKGVCVCPSSLPLWTGQVCLPKINICSGGRVFSLKRKSCVCPSNKPLWNGKACTQYGTYPIPPTHGGGVVTPTPTPGCSGGRYRNKKGQCVCPSNKPNWINKKCVSIKLQGPVYKIPSGVLKLPGIKIQ